MGLLEKIDTSRLPKHIAIIMDGNGRWAKKKGMLRMFGHQSGVKSVRDVCEACAKLNIPYLTVYAFSSENWNRPQQEVNALMTLLVKTIKGETPSLIKNNIRLQAIGNIGLLPAKCIRELNEAMDATSQNTGTTLILALSYSSKWDIVNAFKNIASRIKSGELDVDDINESLISSNLTTHPYPNPELLIRTSGEYRLSNFLLWEVAYSEFHFTEVLWPDFSQEHLYQAIIDYQSRERRFGKTSEQIVS